MRRVRAICVAIILGAIALGATPHSTTAQTEGGGADREWRFIEKLREDGMQDLALRQLETFARDYPNDPRAPQALLTAAQGEAELGRPLRARELCENLLQVFPSSAQAPSAALLRADQFSDEARWEDAAEAYRGLLSAYPGSAEVGPARLGLGEALMSLGNDDEARRLFSGLLGAQSPDSVAARARFDLGVLDLKAGADSLAIERFESIHLQHPQEPIGAFGLVRAAELLEAREATQAAADRYELVIEGYDNPVLRARARLGLARLIEESDPERAVELYRAMLDEGAARDDLKAAYLGLGRSALATGDTSLAGSISTAFLERFADDPEVDEARLIRARALLEDDPELGVSSLEELGHARDPEVAWQAMRILAYRDREQEDLDSASMRWRQAEANTSDPERKAEALLEQTRISMEQDRWGLAADLGVLASSTSGVDSVSARGLQLAAQARAEDGDLAAAIGLARQCSSEFPLSPAAARARADLAVWTRMSVADPDAAAEQLSSLALDPEPGATERALRVGTIQRDLMGDHAAAMASFGRARDGAADPATASLAELELARTAQLSALASGLAGDGRAARSSLREAREALVSVAARAGADDLAMRGRVELLGLDLASAARPDAPWLFDPRTMPLLGAVGPAEEVDPSSSALDDTRRRISSALEQASGDARAWLAWRAAELSREDVPTRLALVEIGMGVVRSEDLKTSLRYTRGQLRLQSGEPAEAARDLARVVEQEELVELSLAARYGLAESQRALKRYDQAGELYEEFAAAWPDTRRGQRAMLLAGDCALFAGRPDEAVVRYRTLLDRYPDSIYRDDTLYRLGTALERAGKLEAARRPLWSLVDDEGGSEYRGRALARLSRIEQSAGQDSLAVVVLSRLVDEDPERAEQEDAWITLATLELERGRPSEALRWSRRLPEGTGDRAHAVALEVQSLAALGRTSEAADRLEELSLGHPDRPELIASARVHLAEGYVDAGDDEAASGSFGRARSETGQAETMARAAFGEGMIAVRAQRWADARVSFEAARDLAPGSEWAAEALYKLGQIYLRESDPVASRQAFAALASGFPQHPRAPQALRAEAQVWRQDGRYEEALRLYHRILDEYPEADGGEEILSNIAYCHHEMGQYDVAIAAYERVMPLLDEEDQAYAQFWIADSMDQLGRHEDAATAFLRIPYLYPSMGQLAVTAQLKAGEAWEHQGDAESARQIYERILSAHGANSQWGGRRNVASGDWGPARVSDAARDPGVISVRGARQHNLRNVDVDLPRHRLVVITGPSGCGKSSLAFDTIYAEGQRRYLESLSTYARQFLEQVPKPDVDRIEGLSPALAIEQKALSHNPRSTVGTATEVMPFLRLLYARVGVVRGKGEGDTVLSATPDRIFGDIADIPEGEGVTIFAPLLRARRGKYRKLLDDLRRRGFVRVRINGDVVRLEDIEALEPGRRHDLDLVVDRLVAGRGKEQRIRSSIETALELGEGQLILGLKGGEERHYSQKASAGEQGGAVLERLEPRLFSFNTPAGACPVCQGLGRSRHPTVARIVPDPELSIADGALAPVRGRSPSFINDQVEFLSRHLGFALTEPWHALDDRARSALIDGTAGDEFRELRGATEGHERFLADFEGLRAMIERRYAATRSQRIRKWCEDFMEEVRCPECEGSRLGKLARSVRVEGVDLGSLSAMALDELSTLLEAWQFSGASARIADPLLAEVRARVSFLVGAGLGYLSLDRGADTLSGGEGQRIRLATQVAGNLTGALYVLDEPSVGLHARDTEQLISLLHQLRDRGNTVLVVEHDRDVIEASDHVVDMGPGAGDHGGEVVAAGSAEALTGNADSPTGRWLARPAWSPSQNVRPVPERWIRVRGMRARNLRGVDLAIPLQRLSVVTGVSGSGKSTAIHDVLHRALARQLHNAVARPGEHDAIEGADQIGKVILIDQGPIGRSPRSTPATFTNLYAHLRKLMAQTPQAKTRGFSAGRFSFNTKGGRCEACSGAGVRTLAMDFLPEVKVVCDECRGQRFNRQTLEITWKGHNIAQLLAMDVESARALLSAVPPIERILATLEAVGLGYLKLGQRADTLSGGEAQRLKLARELSRPSQGDTLYLLDEPTTGLHFEDVEQLLGVLQRLVDKGNSVVVIEHQPDIIQAADWVIDLGPGGGQDGGDVMVAGPVESVLECVGSHTGAMLRRLRDSR